MASIAFDSVSFGYVPASPIFRDLSLRFEQQPSEGQGRLVAIMGPSGSGKTTFLRLVCGLETPLLGSVKLSPASARVSYLQQEPILFEHFSRKENARYFALVRNTRAEFHEPTFRRLSERLRLTTVLESSGGVDELSGGERQRLALLRALSIRPKILLLDEPCTGLDIGVKLEFLHMLREVVDDVGLLALYVTHHSEESELVADELLYFSMSPSGRGVTASLVAMGEALRQPPSVEAAQSFMDPGGNVLSCDLEQSGAFISGAGHVLGRIERGQMSPGRYQLVFPPECVTWKECGEQHVETVGQSAQYWFARANGDERVVGPRTESRPTSFSLNGIAVAFAEGGGPGVRTVISS